VPSDTNKDGWAKNSGEDAVSTFRTSRSIYVSREPSPAPKIELNKKLTCEVGGFMGMMADRSETTIYVDQNEYYLGEKAKVRVVCDNLKCSKSVKSFKLKISRKYIGLTAKRTKATEHGSYS